MPPWSGNGDARHSHHSSVRAAGRMPCGCGETRGSAGVLRLHLSLTSCETNYAQDDRVYFSSVYLPGSAYTYFTTLERPLIAAVNRRATRNQNQHQGQEQRTGVSALHDGNYCRVRVISPCLLQLIDRTLSCPLVKSPSTKAD